MQLNYCRQGKIYAQLAVLIVLLIFATLAILRWQRDFHGDPDHLLVSGAVEGETTGVGSKVGGRLVDLLVQEGDVVGSGQEIARFDVPELLAQRKQLEAKLAEGRSFLQKLEAGPRKQELQIAKAAVDSANEQLEEMQKGTRSEDISAAKASWEAAESEYSLAQKNLKRASELFEADVIAKSDLDQAQTRVAITRESADAAYEVFQKALAGPRDEQIEMAKAQVDSAQAQYDLIKAGARTEDIEAASAQLAFVEAQIEELELMIEEGSVRAAAAGEVLTVNYQAGDLVSPGAPVCTLMQPDTYYIQVFIPEDKLSWAGPGTVAKIYVDAYPDEVFSGTVTYLSVKGEFTPRNLQTKEKRVEEVFRCKIDVDGHDGKLRPGMVCDVEYSRPGIGDS